MDIKFETLEELYKRIKPALITKKMRCIVMVIFI